MKNMTTKEFCKKFGACSSGVRFALEFNNMKECYNALLKGEAGDHSAEWAMWVATRSGVLPLESLLRLFLSVFHAVSGDIDDERIKASLDVIEKVANGELPEDALEQAAGDALDAALEYRYIASLLYSGLVLKTPAAAGYFVRQALHLAADRLSTDIDILNKLKLMGNPFEG